jgi:hypothetical protein
VAGLKQSSGGIQKFRDEPITGIRGAFVQTGCLSDDYSESEINALVANKNSRTGDELGDLFLAFSAKRANQIARPFAHFLVRRCKPCSPFRWHEPSLSCFVGAYYRSGSAHWLTLRFSYLQVPIRLLGDSNEA